jgi:hypothetical protein
MSEPSQERRRFDRIATDKPLLVMDGGSAHRGYVHDVSLRGMLFSLADSWRPSPGERLKVRIELDGELCCIDAEGEVAHVEAGQVGLHCLSVDVESAGKLRRMVELNLADPDLLERNLAELTRG